MKIYLFLILGIFLIGIASASLDCGSNPYFSKTYNKTQIPTGDISITHCSGKSESITLSGQGTSYISLVDIAINGEKDIRININQNIPVGDYLLSTLFVENGTLILSIPMSISIKEIQQQEPTTGCRLIELPHTTTFKLEQGKTGASGEIKVKASTECPELDFNVIEQTQMTKPMYIQSKGESIPGKEYSFTIALDTNGVQTGVYNNYYVVSGSSGNEVYQKSIPLSLIVTIGVSAISNDTFSTLPSCAIDSDMVINSSYKLICQNSNPNINIEVPYNEYFEGISVSETSEKIEFSVKPKKIGNTFFIVLFKYKGVIIGNPFSKEVRIAQGSLPLSGTTLDISFYQNNEKRELSQLLPSDVVILVKDSSTQSVVPSFTAYLNGLIVNNTFKLENEKTYELVISSSGYLSRTLNFTINPQYIKITLSPSEKISEGDNVMISTEPSNVSLFLNGNKLTTNSFTASLGFNEIEGIYPSYVNTKINFTSEESSKILSNGSFKKGIEYVAVLNKNASWKVMYSEDTASQPNQIASGTGNQIIFTPEKKGLYSIYANDKMIAFNEIKGWFPKFAWWVWVIFIVVVIVIVVLIFRKKIGSSGGEKVPPYEFNV